MAHRIVTTSPPCFLLRTWKPSTEKKKRKKGAVVERWLAYPPCKLTKVAPENWWLEHYFHFGRAPFSGATFVSGRVNVAFDEMRSGLEESDVQMKKRHLLWGGCRKKHLLTFWFGEVASSLKCWSPRFDNDFPSTNRHPLPPEAFAELYFGTPTTADESAGESDGIAICSFFCGFWFKNEGFKIRFYKNTFILLGNVGMFFLLGD